jgi:ankyrin repeat protein
MKSILPILVFLQLSCFSFAQSLDQKLIEALKAGDLAKVKVLVESGTDINLLDADGYNALTYALRSNNPDIVYYLKEKGV